MLRNNCIVRLSAEHPSAMLCSADVGIIAETALWSGWQWHAVFCASIHACFQEPTALAYIDLA